MLFRKASLRLTLEEETTMKSTYKKILCLLCLTGFSATVNGIQFYKAAQFKETPLLHNTCPTPSQQLPAAVMVAFVHGGVVDQQGNHIKAGTTIATDDYVTLGSDGFLALHVSNNRSVNIQPDTSTSIACALAARPVKLDVSQPYRAGATRG